MFYIALRRCDAMNIIKKMHFQIRVVCNVVIHVELAGLVHNSLWRIWRECTMLLKAAIKAVYEVWNTDLFSQRKATWNESRSDLWGLVVQNPDFHRKHLGVKSHRSGVTPWSLPREPPVVKGCMLITSSVLTMAGGWGSVSGAAGTSETPWAPPPSRCRTSAAHTRAHHRHLLISFSLF